MKQLKLDVVRFENGDVIATSLCAYTGTEKSDCWGNKTTPAYLNVDGGRYYVLL